MDVVAKAVEECARAAKRAAPSLAMATGLENWPGPSPWEPQVSTYSKAGGGACCAATVCAGREQPAMSNVQTEIASGKIVTLRTGPVA